jgi:hypothetical protein
MVAPIGRESFGPSPIRPVIRPVIKPASRPRPQRPVRRPSVTAKPVLQPARPRALKVQPAVRLMPAHKPMPIMRPVIKPAVQPVVQKQPCRNCGKGNSGAVRTLAPAKLTVDPRVIRKPVLTVKPLPQVDPRVIRQLNNNPLPQPKPPGGGIVKPVIKTAVMPAPKPDPKPEPAPAVEPEPVEEMAQQAEQEAVEQVSSDKGKKAAVTIIGTLAPVAISLIVKKIFG